jgi:hypothetical protein
MLSGARGNPASCSQESELSLATATEEHLRESGTVELLYITAEFEPFSSAQRPDLIFSPERGPSSGKLFVVELRLPRPGRALPTVEELCEHRDFIKTEGDQPFQFALATNLPVSQEFRHALKDHDIEAFDLVTSGKHLASRVLKWTSAAPQTVEEPSDDH